MGKRGRPPPGSSASPGPQRIPLACQEAAGGGADWRKREREEEKGVGLKLEKLRGVLAAFSLLRECGDNAERSDKTCLQGP